MLLTSVFMMLTSCMVFSSFNKFLEFTKMLTPPKRYVSDIAHKWRTTLVSLSHATISSVLSFASLLCLWSDLTGYSVLGEISMSVITGYAIYDTINILQHYKPQNMTSVIIHHVMMAICCASLVFQERYHGYGILTATIEVNAVCLHVRQLLRMYDVPKSSMKYKVSTMVYVASFAYKLVTLLAAMVFCYGDRDRMPLVWNIILLLKGAGLLFVNVILFKQFLTTQFLC